MVSGIKWCFRRCPCHASGAQIRKPDSRFLYLRLSQIVVVVQFASFVIVWWYHFICIKNTFFPDFTWIIWKIEKFNHDLYYRHISHLRSWKLLNVFYMSVTLTNSLKHFLSMWCMEDKIECWSSLSFSCFTPHWGFGLKKNFMYPQDVEVSLKPCWEPLWWQLGDLVGGKDWLCIRS